ncbi:nuclear transport factor 2 family protein [soil metagenome]
MATVEQLRSTLDQYIERFNCGDAAGWAALFADDAAQEDPVGSPVNVGREAITDFYATTRANFGSVILSFAHDPVIVDHEAVMFLEALAGEPGSQVRIPLIADVIIFDPDARIRSLRAFYDPASIIPVAGP